MPPVLRHAIAGLIAIGAAQTDAQTVRSASTAVASDAYVQESWNVTDGLPVNSVTALLQGREGYLWIGTFDGLVRFDGVRFTVFNAATTPGLPSNRIVQLQQTRDGTLLLTTEQRQLVRFKEGRFTALKGEFLDPVAFATLFEDTNGDIWVPTQAGLSVVRGDSLQPVARETIRGRTMAVAMQPDRALWVATRRGDLFRVADGRTTRVASSAGFGGDSLSSLLVDRHGTLWIGGDHGVWRWRDTLVQVIKDPDRRLVTLFEPPRAREVWARTASGMYRIDSTGVTAMHAVRDLNDYGLVVADSSGSVLFSLRDGVLRERPGSSRSVTDLLAVLPSTISAAAYDHEGSLWLGTQVHGLFRIKPAAVRMVADAIGARSDNAYTVLEARDGSVWYGSAGDVVRVTNGEAKVVGGIAPMPGQWIRSILEARDGRLWVGAGDGVYACDPGGNRCERVESPPGLGGVTAMHEDSAGIWFGTMRGLYRRERGTWRQAQDEAPTAPVRAFLRTADGALWMGTAGSGLARLQHGSFRTIGTTDGMPTGFVRALYQDAEGWLWVGTEGRGLVRLDPREWSDTQRRGRIVVIGRKEGLFDETIHVILEDAVGRLWMNGNRGISWIERRDLLDFADGRLATVTSTSYTERDGLRNREGNGGSQPAGARTRDGRLWFPTQDGVAVIDPARIRRNLIPPPVAIEHVVVARDTLRVGGTPLSLGAGQRDLEIAYTGLSFMAPTNVRFRYRLDPYDADWIDAGSRRTAFYTRVPPGNYTFRVLASNNDGVWNEQGATLAFAISPRFWETTAFRLALAFTLVGLTVLAVQLRLRRLRTRAVELEGMVASRTRELSDRNAQLAELHESRSRLFANLSHEFRTPLTLILGPLRSLLDGRHGNLAPSVREQGDLMLRNGQRLLRLINQVLDLSRLQAGAVTLDKRPLDLVAFARATTQAFAPLAERRRITLGVRADVDALPVAADGEQLEKVLLNLLSNAMKFTEPGGSVDVVVRREGNDAVIAVRDTGVGISAEQLPRVFDRFYQADASTTRRYEGTGIGLALAKELVELHGGGIEASSRPGEGSTFTVTLRGVVTDALVTALPRVPAEQDDADDVMPRAPEPAPSEEEAAEDRTTVLLVDDNADVRTFVRSLLADTYRVIEAPDGRAGLAAARAELPDIIVADVMMPELDGLSLGRALKDDRMTDAIPVVLLSARVATEDQVAGLETGADAYLTKPFEPPLLLATVTTLLAQRRRLRDRFQRGVEVAPTPIGPATPATQQSAIDMKLRPLVEARLTDPSLDPYELATAAGLSYHQLYRALRDELSFSPSRYIRTVRVECAAELLRRGKGSVTEIAYSVGFESLSSFSRAFSERFDAPPSTFLKDRAWGQTPSGLGSDSKRQGS